MATRNDSGARRKRAPKSPANKKQALDPKLAAACAALTNIAYALAVAHSSAITIHVALKGQNVDVDREFALSLRLHVMMPLDQQILKILGVVRSLGGDAPEEIEIEP
jgi:hypothetical protein